MKNKTRKIAVIGSVALATLLAFTACGVKKPKKIETFAKTQSINNSLLEERHNFVPKDRKLKASNWAYEIESEPKGNYLFDNEVMVKVFLLAHNAEKIIILGEKRQALQYKKYFRANGVEAQIEVQPIDLDAKIKKRVKILFFSSKAMVEQRREAQIFVPLDNQDLIIEELEDDGGIYYEY